MKLLPCLNAAGQSAIEFSFMIGIVLVFAMVAASLAIGTFYEPLGDAIFREELQKHVTNYNIAEQEAVFTCMIAVTEYPGGIVEYRAGICPTADGQDAITNYLDSKRAEISEAVKARTRYKDVAVLLGANASYCPQGPGNRFECGACIYSTAGALVEGTENCGARPS